MKLIDSHCHIHDENFPISKNQIFELAKENDVQKIICIGVNNDNSQVALDFAEKNTSNCCEIFATIGTHPHEAKNFNAEIMRQALIDNRNSKFLVGIGEIGLDYHYDNSPKIDQQNALKIQLKLAEEFNLPIVFHVREAYDDFWQILDEFNSSGGKTRGVLHSFSDDQLNLSKALELNLFVGVNGISTFAKKASEAKMFDSIPLEKIILETDAPFLSPVGMRGKPNHPANVKFIAGNLAEKRETSFEKIAEITSQNTEELFNI